MKRLLFLTFVLLGSLLIWPFSTQAAYLRDSSTSEIGYEDNIVNMDTVSNTDDDGNETLSYQTYSSTCSNDGQTIYTQSSANYEAAVTQEFGAGYTDSIVTYAQPYDGYSRTVRSQILYTVSLCDSYPGTSPDTTTFVFYHRGYYTIDTYFRVNISTPPTVDITVGKNGGAQQSTTCPVQRTGTCGSYGYATGCWAGGPGYTDCTAPQPSNPDGSAGSDRRNARQSPLIRQDCWVAERGNQDSQGPPPNSRWHSRNYRRCQCVAPDRWYSAGPRHFYRQ